MYLLQRLGLAVAPRGDSVTPPNSGGKVKSSDMESQSGFDYQKGKTSIVVVCLRPLPSSSKSKGSSARNLCLCIRSHSHVHLHNLPQPPAFT